MKDKVNKRISLLISMIMLTEAFFPVTTLALTSGPSQPEVQSFEPVGTTEMVNIFTGDFNYNIPLLEVPGPYGGYPLNLHYNAGITPDQEASWVGLGWNLNVGAITRQKNGLPDEFDGDDVTTTMHQKPNRTIGVSFNKGGEFFGAATSGQRIRPTIFFNNYKGLGYSLSFSKGTGFGENIPMSPYLNLGVTLNSQEGVDMDVSLSLTSKFKSSRQVTNSIGLGYNSEIGLKTLTLSSSTSREQAMMVASKEYTGENSDTHEKKDRSNRSGRGVFSFSNTHYSPEVDRGTTGINLTVGLNLGPASNFNYKYLGGEAYIQQESFVDNGKAVTEPGYGYLHLNSAASNGIMDVNREKDGILRKFSQFLGIPIATPDYYNVTAQGHVDQFRAFRQDYGKYSCPERNSRSYGGRINLEVSTTPWFWAFHFGADISVDRTKTYSGKWREQDAFGESFRSHGLQSLNSDREVVSFRSLGEHIADFDSDYEALASDQPLRIPLGDESFGEWKALNKLQSGNSSTGGQIIEVPAPSLKRKPRASEIHYINNDETKGFVITNQEGVRYTYGQRVLNTKDVESSFSINKFHSGSATTTMASDPDPNSEGSSFYDPSNEQHYYKKELGEYAHSYMLTEITGPDYVDVTNNGVSTDDYGYWVKFHYTTISDYKWRAPFAGYSYNNGINTTYEDNMGSYMYGEKKLCYLNKIETQTHYAEFSLASRDDAMGAQEEFQNYIKLDENHRSQKLNKITLYSWKNPTVPIKTVNFNYEYLLCKGNYNHFNNQNKSINHADVGTTGKLTLTELSFTYENSTRGSLSPYRFYYSTSENNATITSDENPNYSEENKDRWGLYYNSGVMYKPLEPYTQQFDNAQPSQVHRNKLNTFAASWSLRAIKLPTGGLIKVEYEADDYAYVQDKKATQMFKINSLNTSSSATPSEGSWNSFHHSKGANSDSRKIYFKLEHPIEETSTAEADFKRQYLEGIDNVYFKVYMKIRKDGQDYEDYVEGYNNIDVDDCGLDASTRTSVSGKFYYTQGVIYLSKPAVGTGKVGKRDLPYHPFSVAAWNYIRTRNPKIMYPQLNEIDPQTSSSSALANINSLLSVTNMVLNVVKGYYQNCYDQDFGESILPSSSYIRLQSPDGMKVGGGLRVKKITINDNWGTTIADQSEYGMVYDYTTEDKDGNIISSGVAQNEPPVGYDECALRRVYEFSESIPLKLNQNYFTEAPLNESYYPSASVGYSKVTVKSLVAAEETPSNTAVKLSSSGATVYEFFTAKDFPVIVDYTDMFRKPQNFYMYFPLFGAMDIRNMNVSQGYMIMLNDMHGRVSEISEYARNSNGEIDFTKPVSYEKNFYSQSIRSSTGQNVLENKVPVLVSDKLGVTDRKMAYVGQTVEFFTDMRESDMVYESGNIGLNIDMQQLPVLPVLPFFAPIPIPSAWPGFAYNKRRLRMAVTNKVIHRSGILMKTVTYHDGSSVTKENLMFDYITGAPVLTSVTNSFGDPIYTYYQQAHLIYENMGGAYENAGMRVDISSTSTSGGKCTVSLAAEVAALLTPGDELVNGSVKAIVESVNGTQVVMTTSASSLSGIFFIERSGRRNLLNVSAGSIVTLGNKSDMYRQTNRQDLNVVLKDILMNNTTKLTGDPTDNGNRR